MFLIAKVKLGNSYEQARDDLRQIQEQKRLWLQKNNKLDSDEQSQDRRCCMLL